MGYLILMSISTRPFMFSVNWSYKTARHEVENTKMKYNKNLIIVYFYTTLFLLFHFLVNFEI